MVIIETVRERLTRIESGDIMRFTHRNGSSGSVDYIVYVTENDDNFASITGRYTRANDYQSYEHLLTCPYGGFGYDMCIAVEILFAADFDLGI